MTDTSLAERRNATVAELAALGRIQGAALLDGEDFDANLLTAKRGELDVIAAAEAEAQRRAEEAEAAEVAQQREKVRQQAAQELQAYRAAVTDADERTAALVASLIAVRDTGRRLSAYARDLGYPHLVNLDRDETQKAISLILAAALGSVSGKRRYGYLQGPDSLTPATWDGIAARVTPDFEAAIQGAE